jgi:hypothetical protein
MTTQESRKVSSYIEDQNREGVEFFTFETIADATHPKYRPDNGARMWEAEIRARCYWIETRLISRGIYAHKVSEHYRFDLEDGCLPNLTKLTPDNHVKLISYVRGRRLGGLRIVPNGLENDPLFAMYLENKGYRSGRQTEKLLKYSVRAAQDGRINEASLKAVCTAPLSSLPTLDCDGYNHLLTQATSTLAKDRMNFQKKGAEALN